MKTNKEIEKLAKQYVLGGVYLSEQEKQQTEIAYMTAYSQCQEDMQHVEDLSDWDVTLNDGLENEPYVSDDFQIGPDGAYERTQGLSILKEEAKDELIKVLWWQVMDLTMMSKIELGDDVIAEIKRLQNIIDEKY